MMDTRAKAAAQAVKPTLFTPRSTVSPGSSTPGGGDEDVFRPPGLPKDLKAPSEWTPPASEDRHRPEPLLFSLPQRAYTVAVIGCCALAYGQGTTEALDRGILPQNVVDVAAPASLFFWGLNVACAVVGASIAKGKGRSVTVWVFKGILAGLPSVLELKGLPDIIQTELPSGGGVDGPSA